MPFFSSVPFGSDRFESALCEAHKAIEDEPDNPDGYNAEDNMLVDQRVVLLPEKTADSGTAGEHFGRNDDEPRNSEAKAKPGKHVRQGGREKYFEKGFRSRKFKHSCHV